ncbi:MULTISPECIES: ATP-binding protein [unclassified Streptomyces]|uniref:ATP-binding protein n=1 Tax=unclassified Streptomyces TaxID=2593676 RepID=UPI0009A0F2A4|nr:MULTISPECIES: ATP-binding protein [unclassified Streptomyces]
MAQEHSPRSPGRSASAAAPLRHTVEVFLPSEPPHVKTSRRVAASALERWGGIPAMVADDAVLIVSELVTNAILHGGVDPCEAVGLRIGYTRNELLIEVTDGNSQPAQVKAAGGTETGGRGLLLVTRLVCEWGTCNENRTTWARLSTHPQEQAC